MDALLDSALVAGLIMAALGLLVVAAAVSDHFTRTEEPRCRPHSDPATDHWREDTQDFFHPTGRMSTAVAFARSKEMAPTAAERLGAMTPSKEITHARSDR